MAKVEAERHRGDEHENTRAWNCAGSDEGEGAGSVDGGRRMAPRPSPMFSPEQEMLDLREAITRLGRQIARLNMRRRVATPVNAPRPAAARPRAGASGA